MDLVDFWCPGRAFAVVCDLPLGETTEGSSASGTNGPAGETSTENDGKSPFSMGNRWKITMFHR